MTVSSNGLSETRNDVLVHIRPVVLTDVASIRELLLANRPIFSDVECRVALEMVEQGLTAPSSEDPYQFLAGVVSGHVISFACYGSISLTDGGFDLYWLAVHPRHQRQGIGRLLLDAVEARIAAQAGRLVVAETSGRADYRPTRQFYIARGYVETAVIRDFYRPGDDKVVYVKYL